MEDFSQLYHSLWNKGDAIRDKIIYDVTFTQPDFDELQRQAAIVSPRRSSPDYVAEDKIMNVKYRVLSYVLRSQENKKFALKKNGVASGANPLPCRATLLDLRPLNLTHFPLDEKVILIRDEYRSKYRTLLDHRNGSLGSAMMTGEPGIGKTYFLYYLLIERLLQGSETFFEDMYANLFHFSPSHPGTRIETEGQSPFSSIKNEDDVWILVEGARDSFRDFHRFITNGTQMRVIVACLPYHAAKPPQWLERVCGQDYKMSVWSWEELFVVGHFLYPYDVIPDRLVKCAKEFGQSTHLCFEATRGSDYEDDAGDELNDHRMMEFVTTGDLFLAPRE